jgi:uncharacterized protein YhaN
MMATDTQKYESPVEQEPRHSAIAEFSRDERRPAVLLLSALLLSALFFGLGLMVGRWTAAQPESKREAAASANTSPVQTSGSQPHASPTANSANEMAADTTTRRFALLVATYDVPEKAQTLVKTLQEAGYTDIRTSSPRAGETRPRYSVLVGRFTQDEAREAARRMRSANDPRLRNAKVIESNGQ